MAETFLSGGKYTGDKNLQVNHIDGNKLNNNIDNLELVTQTENVNHAHNMGLYTFDLEIEVTNILTKTKTVYRSLRELARILKVSVNYLKPRIVISTKYPLFGRYVLKINVDNYLNHISKLHNKKLVYVYDHYEKRIHKLTSFSQISILFGVPYTTIGKKLRKYQEPVYTAGYTFSMYDLSKEIVWVKKLIAFHDRMELWKKLAANVLV